MFDNIPKGWRKGQTVFNFLEWVRNQKKEKLEDWGDKEHIDSQVYRLADIFYIPDNELDIMYDEFMDEVVIDKISKEAMKRLIPPLYTKDNDKNTTN